MTPVDYWMTTTCPCRKCGRQANLHVDRTEYGTYRREECWKCGYVYMSTEREPLMLDPPE